MLATLEPNKGHHFLLLVFEKVIEVLPDVQLLMCGYGTNQQKESIVEAIRHHGLQNNVSLLNFQTNPFSLIHNASIVLVPSQSYESFGLTIIEAMALKTPVIASDIGGMPEVIHDTDSGYVCSSKSIDEFYNRIITILSNPDLARTLGKNGRNAFLSRYTASIMVKKYYSMVSAEYQL